MAEELRYRAPFYARYFTLAGPATDADGRYYRRFARVAAHHHRRLLPEDRSSRILDLGCGHGTMLFTLRSLGYRNLVGVDRSPEQIARARRIHPDVYEADAASFLAERAGAFDAILALDLIEHLTKDEALRLVEACRGALAPGGRLILQLPNGDCPRGLTVAAGDLSHEVCYTPTSIRQLLSLAGFDRVTVHAAGPVPRRPSGLIRWVLWRIISLATTAYDVIETGRPGSGVHTRVMIAAGRAPQ